MKKLILPALIATTFITGCQPCNAAEATETTGSVYVTTGLQVEGWGFLEEVKDTNQIILGMEGLNQWDKWGMYGRLGLNKATSSFTIGTNYNFGDYSDWYGYFGLGFGSGKESTDDYYAEYSSIGLDAGVKYAPKDLPVSFGAGYNAATQGLALTLGIKL